MTTSCRVALLVALALAMRVPVAAQAQGEYRDFQLGASVATISTLTDTRTTDVTVVPTAVPA